MSSPAIEFSLPESPAPTREDVFRVEQLKYGVDRDSPWWRRWFFRGAFLPFNRFSRKVMGIPALGAVEPESAICPSCGADVPGPRFSWVEDQGTFSKQQWAKAVCLGEFWRVRASPLNASLPGVSCEYASAPYPKAKKPDRYTRRGKRSYLLKPAGEATAEEKGIARAIKRVDEIRASIRTSTLNL